jgi:hypothetical protein
MARIWQIQDTFGRIVVRLRRLRLWLGSYASKMLLANNRSNAITLPETEKGIQFRLSYTCTAYPSSMMTSSGSEAELPIINLECQDNEGNRCFSSNSMEQKSVVIYSQ